MRLAAQELGDDAVEADEVSEVTKDVARARYQRLFWEPVVEGKVCTVSHRLAPIHSSTQMFALRNPR